MFLPGERNQGMSAPGDWAESGIQMRKQSRAPESSSYCFLLLWPLAFFDNPNLTKHDSARTWQTLPSPSSLQYTRPLRRGGHMLKSKREKPLHKMPVNSDIWSTAVDGLRSQFIWINFELLGPSFWIPTFYGPGQNINLKSRKYSKFPVTVQIHVLGD